LTHSQIDNYLAIIYLVECEEDEIIAAQLTESLDVSTPTMTATLKRKAGDGWIATEEGCSFDSYSARTGTPRDGKFTFIKV
jgi:Mn-dependent DtxR family transcriptional regulator